MLTNWIRGTIVGASWVAVSPLGMSILVYLIATRFYHVGLLGIFIGFAWSFFTIHVAVMSRSGARATRQAADRIAQLANQGYSLVEHPPEVVSQQAANALKADLRKQKASPPQFTLIIARQENAEPLPALLSFPLRIDKWILVVDRLPNSKQLRRLIEFYHELGHIAACLLSIETREVWIRLSIGYLTLLALNDSNIVRICVIVALVLDIFTSSSPYENEVAADAWAFRQVTREYGRVTAEQAANRLIRVLSADAQGGDVDAKMAMVRIKCLRSLLKYLPKDPEVMERAMSIWPKLGAGRVAIPIGLVRIALGMYAGLTLSPDSSHLENLQRMTWVLWGISFVLMVIANRKEGKSRIELELALVNFVKLTPKKNDLVPR